MQNIRDLNQEAIQSLVADLGHPKYRSKQLLSWLYGKGVDSFDQMKTLPSDLKVSLKGKYSLQHIRHIKDLLSKDGTRKFIFSLHDNNCIESVLIPSKKRFTLCISTQVGCKFGCSFCASGKRGFIRNLTLSEILDQIIFLKVKKGLPITNYVFMGMGEPLDNYDNLIDAIDIMISDEALNIGSRRITLSTSGIVPKIRLFADKKMQTNLSISLHGANNSLRGQLMPINKKYNLKALMDACRYYGENSNRIITFEYIMIKGLNIKKSDAKELSSILSGIHCKINLIPYSSTLNTDYKTPSEKDIGIFTNALDENRLNFTLRNSKGSDIDAACGQLAYKVTDET